MKAVGIDPDSEFGKIIKDPINAVKNIGENLGGESIKALENVTIAAEKALTDTKRETETALTNTREATEKALTDVKRETDKALTDARKTTEKALEDVAREIGRVMLG